MESLRREDPRGIGPYVLLARGRETATVRQYVARDPAGRTATVQVPHARLTGSAAFRRRFRAEADLATRLGGDWAAPVLDTGPDPDEPWLATAYLPGVPLGTAVHERGPLPQLTVRCLGAALAETLARLHALAGVHQGLAPHTVLLAADGPRLTGFGPLAAASAAATDGDGRLTLTLDYLTPEQIAGRPPGPASDIFMLGMLLVYAATGTSPFPGGGDAAPGIANAVPDLGGVPAGLRPLLTRCLEKDPARRPEPERVAAGFAPGSTAALMRDDNWLPGDLVTRISADAAAVMALDTGKDAVRPAPTLVHGDDPDRPGDPDSPTPPTTARTGAPARRQLLAAALAGGAGLAVGAGAMRVLGGGEAGKSGAPSGARGRKRVAGTAPAALWHVRLDDGLHGEPTVWQNDVLFLPGGRPMGLDLRTGKTRWQQDDKLYVLASPAVIGGELAVFPTQRGMVHLVPADGTVRYTHTAYAIGKEFDIHDLVATDGTRMWLNATVSKAPVKKDNGLFLICYDAVARRELWRVPLPKGYPSGGGRGVAGAAQPGRVVLRRESPFPLVGDGPSEFLAVHPSTGKQLRRGPLPTVMAFHQAWPSPDGRVYALTNELSAYDAVSGRQVWKAEDSLIVANAVLPRGDAVYATGSGGSVHAFEAATGRLRWESRFLREAATDEDVSLFADPAGRVLLTGDKACVTAVAAGDGKVLWRFAGRAVQDMFPWKGIAVPGRAVLWQGLDIYALPLD